SANGAGITIRLCVRWDYTWFQDSTLIATGRVHSHKFPVFRSERWGCGPGNFEIAAAVVGVDGYALHQPPGSFIGDIRSQFRVRYAAILRYSRVPGLRFTETACNGIIIITLKECP